MSAVRPDVRVFARTHDEPHERGPSGGSTETTPARMIHHSGSAHYRRSDLRAFVSKQTLACSLWFMRPCHFVEAGREISYNLTQSGAASRRMPFGQARLCGVRCQA